MKNNCKNIMTSRYLRAFLLLFLVYFSQVTPFHQKNHFHENGLIKQAEKTVSFETESSHSSDHHHHDQDQSHTDDHQHTNDHQHSYDNQIDWHVVRTQSQKTLSFENQYVLSSVVTILSEDNSVSDFIFQEPPDIDSYENSILIIRGPPFIA